MKKYLAFGDVKQIGEPIYYGSLEEYIDLENEIRIKNATMEQPLTFEMDKSGMPILENIEAVRLITKMFEKQMHIITGKEMGKGLGKEVLLEDIKYIQKIEIPITNLSNHILKTMIPHFQYVKKETNESSNNLWTFEEKKIVNILTGEKAGLFTSTVGEEWVALPEYTSYRFKGWGFYAPVDDFCKCDEFRKII